MFVRFSFYIIDIFDFFDRFQVFIWSSYEITLFSGHQWYAI